MAASFVSFCVSLGISFLLTPFIVKSLGAAAYGFVGLSTNIISYTQLLTIALNSMAGRFITIKYAQGKIDEANKYFSSVFYSNLVLSAIIVAFLGSCVFFLEEIFEIPDELVIDVKFLFLLLVINSIAGLLTNVYAIATFIKNRLELSSIRSIIGSFIRAILLLVLFGLLEPRLWYIGVSGMVLTAYMSFTNYKYTQILAPELYISRYNFEWAKVKELVSSGAWNLLSKLGEILGTGLDLVIANLFIGATAMGILSITKTVPVQILSIFAMISSVFAPLFTKLYAEGKKNEMLLELKKSIRILGFFTTVPLACLYVLGKEFYSLWLPGQDAEMLQTLTIVGTIGLTFAMPLEALWNIFTITNKIKYSSMVTLLNNVIIIIIVLTSMLFVESEYARLLILAGTRTCTGTIRVVTFLPLYGAKCLDLPKYTFFPPIIKSVTGIVLSLVICYVIKSFVCINSWFAFFISVVAIIFITTMTNYFILLEKGDRSFIKQKILKLKK